MSRGLKTETLKPSQYCYPYQRDLQFGDKF